MCGVAGIIDYRGKSDSIPAVEEMLRSFSYRGPDESGIYHSPVATIGNVRLSIIDLVSGQQPLSDMTGRYWIVFNGEIFNYIELRKDLEDKGVKLTTQSDTEVLVNLFALYGEKCLGLLNGQFAVAIWDKKEEKLFIARDRVGIRPLFYTVADGVFYFASEIKALFRNAEVKRELNPENLAQIYTFWTAITPSTAFRNISELSPGHYLTFGKEGLTVRKFWELSFSGSDSAVSPSDALDGFNELFTNAVRIRLRADVEVAAYLSGGIDSSTTVAYIKDIEPGVLNTFSIGFEDKDFDESKFQEEAVRYLNTNHRAISCTSKEIAEAFPRVVWHSETPLTRTAPTPMLILSKLVRDNNIKVVITGEGSDEILAGYDIFREAIIRRFWASQPSSSLRPTLLKKIYPDIPHLRNTSPNILKMFFGYKLEDTANPLYSHLLRWNNSNHIKKHFSEHIRESVNGYDPLADLAGRLPESFMEWSPLARAQWLETTVFMSGYLLSSQGDRMAMANSVEGRYPFLDYRVIEYCSSLPDKLKLNGLNEKYLLKKLMTGRIPESIVKRPKQPYRAPISSVFMGREKPDYVDEMLSEKMTRLAGIFSHESVAALLAKIEKAGTASEMDNMVLAAVISTHLVHSQFIENNNSEFRNGPLRNLRIIEEKQ
ncbi:MAG TPA: asparagine synthase (glutamine-hydrolyzing) [Bacteroidales bacterium]|jgi:asparagine synthase (glutamine-hydrolysing)|nr:asparagine synthase (glutamine-hydrolyzing) [Bacteroidales bacterium]HOG57537.1 asparagine synthase (glutamine-hydrolyzing) [Bacteroidales bacterium]